MLNYCWHNYFICTQLALLLHSRVNNTKILEFLSDAWAKDRRNEWSIWMVYSKVEMPHHYINGNPDSSHHIVDKRVSSFWKLADEVNAFDLQTSCWFVFFIELKS